MKNVKLILATLLIGGVWAFSACQKSSMNSASVSSDITAASDAALMDHQSNYVDAIAQAVTWNTAGETVLSAETLLPPCATVTYDTTGTLRTATINFGTTPCRVPNGEEFRQGTLVITWTGNMRDSGTVKTITPQNYFVGDSATEMNKFDFLKTWTNMGTNANGNLHFLVTMRNASLTLWSGGTITWNGNHDWEWTEGSSTPNREDDVFMITGGHSGIDRKGEPFTAEITNALKKDACEWIVSGTKEVTHGDGPTRTIDYGDGTCDNLATVTMGDGKTRVIQIDRDDNH